MKHFLLLALAMLFTVSVSAATLETQSNYVKVDGSSGLSYGLNYLSSVYTGTDLVKDVSLGAYTNLATMDGNYNFVAAPIVKLSIPIFYTKLGLGWNYSKIANVSDNAWVFLTGVGFNFELASNIKAGVDFTYLYNINNKVSMYQFGPMFSFNP
jgi:hypothetical protein